MPKLAMIEFLLLFLTFSVLVAIPKKKLLYTVANPARGLPNRGKKKKKKKSGSAPAPPRCSFGENKIKITRRIYMKSLKRKGAESTLPPPLFVLSVQSAGGRWRG